MKLFKLAIFNRSTADPDDQLYANSPSLDVREAMKRQLPQWMQPLLTWVTAKPYAGQKPFRRSAMSHLVSALVALGLGASLSWLGASMGGTAITLVPLGWFFSTYGTRKLRLMMLHFCSHNAVFERRVANFWLGEIISILTLSLSFKQYQQQHTRFHHSRHLLEPGDETYEFLVNFVGLKPGMPVERLWRQLWITLVSPKFHLRNLLQRLRECFLSTDPKHNALAGGLWLLILGLVAMAQCWMPFTLTFGVPLTVLLQISALLQNCVEHRWLVPPQAGQRQRRELGQLTVAVFLGEFPPVLPAAVSPIQRVVAWSYWTARMLFYHLPARALVMMGDIPCHDYHHRHPGSKEWPNYIFARQADGQGGSPGWPEPYQETWGLLEAMEETFQSLSQQPLLK